MYQTELLFEVATLYHSAKAGADVRKATAPQKTSPRHILPFPPTQLAAAKDERLDSPASLTEKTQPGARWRRIRHAQLSASARQPCSSQTVTCKDASVQE